MSRRAWREVDSALCEALLAVGDAETALDVVQSRAEGESVTLVGVSGARDALRRQIGERCGGRAYADGDEVIVVDPATGFEEVVYHRGSGAAAGVDSVLDWWTEVETAVQELMETRSRLARLEAQIQRARDRGRDDPAVLIDRLIADLGLARWSASRLRPLIGDGDES